MIYFFLNSIKQKNSFLSRVLPPPAVGTFFVVFNDMLVTRKTFAPVSTSKRRARFTSLNERGRKNFHRGVDHTKPENYYFFTFFVASRFKLFPNIFFSSCSRVSWAEFPLYFLLSLCLFIKLLMNLNFSFGVVVFVRWTRTDLSEHKLDFFFQCPYFQLWVTFVDIFTCTRPLKEFSSYFCC